MTGNKLSNQSDGAVAVFVLWDLISQHPNHNIECIVVSYKLETFMTVSLAEVS